MVDGTSSIAVEVVALHKSFGDVAALNGVTLRIGRGEFFGLLGPNGAGKTTLLRILSGVLKSDNGQVSVFGHAAGNEGAVRSLGIVPQEIALYEMLSARRNLELFGSLHGISGNRLAERVRSVLNVVGLDEHQHRRVKTFSGGMKRRLNLAIGLLHDPPVLLLDEPTVGVDPQSRARIFALLKDLHAAGKTIIYTTHYMEEAERLCQRIGIIDRGRVLAEGSLSDLFLMVTTQRSVRLYLSGGKDSAVRLEGTAMTGDSDYVDYIPGSADRLGHIVVEIERTGMHYDRLEIVGPSLETLFLQLTGKELRD